MAQQLAFSMVFKVIDEATSGIRQISETLKAPAAAIGQIAKAAGDASQKFANSFTGMGAIVAEGFSIKAVAAQEEFFRRMQINSGMSDDAITKLKETMNSATEAARISGAQMMDAFKSFKGNGGTTEVFEQSAQTMASAIQLLGGHGEELGEMFANLQTKMGVTKGEEFLDFLATARKQLAGIDGGMDNFATSSNLLMSSYLKLGHSGESAAKELTAVYAIIAKGTGSAKQAKGLTEGLLQNLGDQSYQMHLAGQGIQVWNDPNDPRSGVKSVTDIVSQISQKFAADPHQAEQAFGKDMGEALKVPIGEIKKSGHSESLEKIFGAQGDGADFLKKAQEASMGLSGSINALEGAIHKVAEHNLAGPINLFASALSHCTGPIAYVLMGLAGLAAVGHAVGWISGAVTGFMQFAKVLSLINVALLANPITWVVLGVIALAGAIYLVYRNWSDIVAFFAPTWKVIEDAFTVTVDAIYQSWSGIVSFFTAKWDGVKEAFDHGWVEGVVKLLSEFNPVSLLGDAMNGLIKWLLGFDLAEAGRKMIGSLIQGIQGAVDMLPDAVRKLLGLDVGGAVGAAWDGVKSTGANAWEGVKSTGGAAWEGVKSGVGGAVSGIKNGVGSALDAASGTSQHVMSFFEGKGWSHEQAAGLAANLGRESGFKPGAVGDGGKAFGVAQWHPDRQAAFAQFSGHDIRQSSLDEQLAFVHHELTAGAESRAGKALANATSAAQAGAVVSKLYERPADREGEAARRGAAAEGMARSSSGPAAPASAMAAAPASPPSAFAGTPAKSEVAGTITVRLEGAPAGTKATVESATPGLTMALGMGPVMAGAS